MMASAGTPQRARKVARVEYRNISKKRSSSASRSGTRAQDDTNSGSTIKCAGCAENTGPLCQLPERLKSRSPSLCVACLEKFVTMPVHAKVCTRQNGCLCTDDDKVGATMCPLRGHRDTPSQSLFDRTFANGKTSKYAQCYRCRDRRKKSETKMKKKATELLTTYSHDEIASWKIATGCDGDPVMPELQKDAAIEPTYFSSELAPDKWCSAQKLLLKWEQQHGVFPTTMNGMDAFWNKKASEFVNIFTPAPRLHTKEAVVPYILARRLLGKLSLFLKKSTDDFVNVDEPTLEEWIKVMADEPLYETVVKQFWIPLYISQGLLEESFKFG